ncbi:MAG: GspE/PulE family protein [Planctomycetes bacterium]|jgi:type IV pilus assembly protein PilB|nr:GspE/PulE family protein [Planctomycetota bacterium]
MAGKRLIGQVLKSLGAVHEGQVQEALSLQAKEGGLLGEILVRKGYCTRDQVVQARAKQAGMDAVDLAATQPDPALLSMVPFSVANVYQVVPVRLDGEALVVALADPDNASVLDDLRFMVGREIRAAVAGADAVADALQRWYAGREESVESVKEEAKRVAGKEAAYDLEDPAAAAASAPVVKLLNLILLQAVKDRASDIHFEPFEDEFKVRYRIDGVLYEMSPPPKSLALALISRIKVMANLDIAETRLPQDGRIELTIGGLPVDLRISTLPTMFGESVVMRVLDRSTVQLDLTQIGLLGEDLETVRKLITLPNGIILVTGPTGCGKTTTLYSALNIANTIDTKIITTEDPVEYDLEGVMQVQVNEEIGLGYAHCLRSILRQDPDVILVGEIRDPETAQIAVEASLTGHIVFSTLHTNDAPSTVARVLDLDVPPFLIAATLEAVIAQRLVRKICPACKAAYAPDEREAMELGLTREALGGRPFHRGKGCANCHGSGYRGRTGIFEIMIVGDEIKNLIMDRASTDAIRNAARRRGMKVLREAGIRAVLDGVTTVEEVQRETLVW